MSGWRPIAILILNFIVGIAVSHGIVDAASKDEIVTILTDVIGNIIILITSIAAIIHILKRPHDMSPVAPKPSIPEASPQKPVETTPKEPEQLG